MTGPRRAQHRAGTWTSIPWVCLGAALVGVVASGCIQSRSWSYQPSPRLEGRPIVGRAVTVLPLEDRREGNNSNRLALMLVPGMPFARASLDMPEALAGGRVFGIRRFNMSEQIAKDISRELDHSGIFRAAGFGYRPAPNDLALRGVIRSTRFDQVATAYGLSFFGPLLWMLGFPAASSSTELWLELELEDPSTGDVLWSQTLRRTGSGLAGLYFYPRGIGDPPEVDQLLSQTLIPALANLRSVLTERASKGSSG